MGALFPPGDGEEAPDDSAGEVALPADADLDGEDAPDNAAVQEGHHHGDADEAGSLADQSAEEEEGGQGVDDPAQSDVVAVRSAEPEETARGQPRPAQHLEAKVSVEVEEQGIEREEGNGVAPQVLEVAMKQGHGEDAGQSVRVQRAVAEAPEFESELLIDEEDPPDDH